MGRLLLRCARWLEADGRWSSRDLAITDGVVAKAPAADAVTVELEGRAVLPALVNAHDVLDLASLPPLGVRPPYPSLYEWTRACEAETAGHAAALAIPFADRLFLGGLRNLLAGTAAVLHHHPDHRSLARADFPVRVQRRYAFAHSPRLTAALRRTYRTTDRRQPWIVHAAEGGLPALRGEIEALAAANVLRQNTVIAHGTALEPEDAARLASARASLAWCPESDLRLYGRTAPAVALLRGGVRVGLGSDGAPAGARDLLSTLAVARGLAGLSDEALLQLATRGSAEVARMPAGDAQPGTPADLLVTGSLPALLAGQRAAVALLIVRGEPVCGEPGLLAQSGRPAVGFVLDGAARALACPLARRLRALVRRHPVLRRTAWLSTLEI